MRNKSYTNTGGANRIAQLILSALFLGSTFGAIYVMQKTAASTSIAPITTITGMPIEAQQQLKALFGGH